VLIVIPWGGSAVPSRYEPPTGRCRRDPRAASRHHRWSVQVAFVAWNHTWPSNSHPLKSVLDGSTNADLPRSVPDVISVKGITQPAADTRPTVVAVCPFSDVPVPSNRRRSRPRSARQERRPAGGYVPCHRASCRASTPREPS